MIAEGPLDFHGLHVDNPGSMTTVTGLRVDPLDMDVDDICIMDIAHALSRQCRYNGHTEGFLSVARHSIWVAQTLQEQGYGQRTVLTGLLHDAAEAYLGDMIRPLKHGELGADYITVETALEEVIAEAFGLFSPLPESVLEADRYVLLHIELPHPNGARHTWDTSPLIDKIAFLNLFDRLQKDAL